MTATLERAVQHLLREGLRGSDELLPFARSVVLHLTGPVGPGWTQQEAVERLLAALSHALDSRTVDSRTPPLVGHPELLASFFQNADLLDPKSPRTPQISGAVMSAIDWLSRSS